MTVHKTFHCYTVRAKQGGGQSARDAKGGNAPKSAGASLRRYNEQALVQVSKGNHSSAPRFTIKAKIKIVICVLTVYSNYLSE